MNYWEWAIVGFVAGVATVALVCGTAAWYVMRHPKQLLSYFMSKAKTNSSDSPAAKHAARRG